MAINTAETCRTCLKVENLTEMHQIFCSELPSEIFSSHNLLAGFFFEYLSIKLNDGISQHICTKCQDFINSTSQFLNQCEHARNTLEETLKDSCKNNPENDQLKFLKVEKLEDLKNETLEASLEEESDDDFIERLDDFDPIADSNSNNVDLPVQHGILDCKICGKNYKRRHYLQRHIEIAHNTKEVLVEKIEADTIENETKSENTHICPYCKVELFSDFELELHLKTAHPKDRPHMCPICGKSFPSVSNRNTHVQSHNDSNTFTCDICQQGFKSKTYLRKHIKSVHTISNHDCPHCPAKFNNTIKYEYHLKSHSPHKKYKCQFCEKSFLQQHHLANHERTHTGLKPYLCNICGKDFKQECNFKMHLRIHSGARPYACKVCEKDFVQRSSYVLHMRQHSGLRPYQCEHCGKGFTQKSSLNIHLRTHTGEKPYKCDICECEFAQMGQLKCHKFAVHGGPSCGKSKGTKVSTSSDANSKTSSVKKNSIQAAKGDTDSTSLLYTCTICSKAFKLPWSLSTHYKIHAQIRKYACTQCDNTFKRAEHLRVHISRVHLKQKPYPCPICFKRFAQSGDRNVHARIHTGEKPHACTYCNKSFSLVKALKVHMRIHTGEKPYSCEICKNQFMTYKALASHNNTKHKMSVSQDVIVENDLAKLASICNTESAD